MADLLPSYRNRRADVDNPTPEHTQDEVETNNSDTAEMRRFWERFGEHIWPLEVNRKKMLAFLKRKDQYHNINDTSGWSHGRNQHTTKAVLQKTIIRYLRRYEAEGVTNNTSDAEDTSSTPQTDAGMVLDDSVPPPSYAEVESKKRPAVGITEADEQLAKKKGKHANTTTINKLPQDIIISSTGDGKPILSLFDEAASSPSLPAGGSIHPAFSPALPPKYQDEHEAKALSTSYPTANEKDAMIVAQRNEISRLNMMLHDRPADHKRHMEAKTAQLAEQHHTIGRQNEKIINLERANSERDREITKLRQENLDQAEEIAWLKERLAASEGRDMGT